MIAKKEERQHKKKLKEIEEKGQRHLMRQELRNAREKYWPKPKKPSTAKVALAYIFGSCTIVQVYSMVAMWHFADLSPLISLIGATVGEAISYCAYAAKSTKENTKGGITYEMAMAQQPPDPEEDLEYIDLEEENK